MNLKIIEKDDWETNEINKEYLHYNKLNINNNTKLEDFYYIINKNKIYIINYNYKINTIK